MIKIQYNGQPLGTCRTMPTLDFPALFRGTATTPPTSYAYPMNRPDAIPVRFPPVSWISVKMLPNPRRKPPGGLLLRKSRLRKKRRKAMRDAIFHGYRLIQQDLRNTNAGLKSETTSVPTSRESH